MEGLKRFLQTSYTAYQTVENAAALLEENGFMRLSERDSWHLSEGEGYFTVRGGSLIAFRYGKGPFKILASHTDSPCFKLKENAAMQGDAFTRLNTEEYGGAIRYTFFDIPLRIAGRVVRETETGVQTENFVSPFVVVIPSLAIHMNRDVNDGFKPDLQKDTLPLLSLGKTELSPLLASPLSYDLFASPDVTPFEHGATGEFLSSPRLDDLTSVYASLNALIGETVGACVCACFNHEEIGSRTYGGAGSGFLSSVLARIAEENGETGEDFERMLASSLLVSLDNAHSIHPNSPEKCDPTNHAVMGGGVVIKGHAGGAYTTDALTSAVMKKIFQRHDVKYQMFFNRSDMRSGSTLGAVSLSQVSVPSVDLGIAQLAMHSAVETIAKADYFELEKALTAILTSKICMDDGSASL